MAINPILSRELRTSARRGGGYRRRCSLAGALWLVLCLLFGLAASIHRQPLSIREMATFSVFVLGLAAECLVGLTVWLVPACTAAAIAEEKERRTITHLLTTRLSSAEIVLGKLAAGLVQYTAGLAACAPILILLPLLGGADPWLVLLVLAGTASTAFFVAGLSIVVSTAARRGSRAVAGTIGLTALWCGLPLVVHLLTPRTLPWLWPWVYPVNQWLLASAPTGVLLAGLGPGPGWRILDTILWMIGLQMVAGSVLVAWAVARFRPACRNLESESAGDREAARGIARLLRYGRPRLLRRPPCGANPVLWKELHTTRPHSLADLIGLVFAAGLLVLVAYGTYHFARPAFAEWFAGGPGSTAVDVKRTEFNAFLRHVTSWIEFFTLLIAAGGAAEGITSERARQTWDSLIATPLDGRAIVRAKMIGAAWRVRWGLILLCVLWSVGLLAGALHPLGFAAALVVLGVATWLMVALGTFMSLVSRDAAQASNRTLIPVLFLSASFLVCYLPTRAATILMGAASAPLVTWLSLASYRDAAGLLTGQYTFSPLTEIGVHTYEGPLRVLATCLLGMGATAIGAHVLSRATVRRFDHAAGRPERVLESEADQSTQLTARGSEWCSALRATGRARPFRPTT
jgi:ABC-type transport system involved in multi-copper enzyme maturation permease subunit